MRNNKQTELIIKARHSLANAVDVVASACAEAARNLDEAITATTISEVDAYRVALDEIKTIFNRIDDLIEPRHFVNRDPKTGLLYEDVADEFIIDIDGFFDLKREYGLAYVKKD